MTIRFASKLLEQRRMEARFVALGFLPAASSYVIVPMLPHLLQGMNNLNPVAASEWIAFWMLIGTGAQIPAHFLLRRFGSTCTLLTCAVLSTGAFPLALVSGSLWLSTLAFGVGAVGLGLIVLQSTGLCEAAGDARSRAFSFLHTGANCGAIAAPVATYVLADRGLIFALGILSALRMIASGGIAILVWRSGWRAPKKGAVASSTIGLRLLNNPTYLALLIIGAIYSFLYTQLIYTSQIIVTAEFAGFRLAPFLISMNAGLVLIFQPLFLRLSRRRSNGHTITVGAGLALAGWIALLLSPSTEGLIILTIFFSAAEVFIIPSAMALIGELLPGNAKMSAYAGYSLTRLAGPVAVVVGSRAAALGGLSFFAVIMSVAALLMLVSAALISRARPHVGEGDQPAAQLKGSMQ